VTQDKQQRSLLGFKRRQSHFIARELQTSLALLVVVALLGGVFLQSASKLLSSYFTLSTPTISLILVIGYILIIVFLAILFSYRLIGPFKRLEYEMKIISKGEIAKRLSIRTKDDHHIKKFVAYANDFIDDFETMSKNYNNCCGSISNNISEVIKKLEMTSIDPEDLKTRLKAIQCNMHDLKRHR